MQAEFRRQRQMGGADDDPAIRITRGLLDIYWIVPAGTQLIPGDNVTISLPDVERARVAIGKGANEPQLEGAGAQVSEEAAKSRRRRGRKERSQRLRDERRWLAWANGYNEF